MAQLREQEATLQVRQIGVVCVGSGTHDMARDFVEAHNVDVPVFTDRSCAVFAKASMRRGWFATLRPRTLLNSWRAFRAGFRQSRVQGSALQQGGMLLFDEHGTQVGRWCDRAAGDTLSLPAVLTAVDAM